MANPLHQFEIKTLMPLEFMGYDISITNSALFMILTIVCATLFMNIGLRKKEVVPGRWQLMTEMTYEFIAGMVKDNIGIEGKKYFPLVFALFMFILFANLLGMFPASFTATSHVVVTFSLAALVFITMLAVGFTRHGLKFFTLFIPSGLPMIMVPLMFIIELISFLSRPISLSIRLAAAMTAGHIALKVFAGFVVMFFGMGVFGMIGGIILPLPILVALIGLEFFIAFLQAYIFAMLTSIYLNDSVHLH